MSSKQWLITWGAASALWVLYWIGMSMTLGVETVRDMVAELGWPVLVGGLMLSAPAALFLGGALAGCALRCCKGRDAGS